MYRRGDQLAMTVTRRGQRDILRRLDGKQAGCTHSLGAVERTLELVLKFAALCSLYRGDGINHLLTRRVQHLPLYHQEVHRLRVQVILVYEDWF
jgi:hypothetical protein